MKKIYLIMIGAVLIILLLAGALFTGWSMLAGRADNGYVSFVANVVPIPAAKVGSRTILYRDYLDSRETMRIFLASDAAKEQNLVVPFDATLEENILMRLMNEEALRDIAEQNDVSVPDEDLMAFFDEVTAAASSTAPDIGVYLLDTYGWDEQTFRNKVLYPALLEQKLYLELSDKQSEKTFEQLIEERLAQDDVKRYVQF